MKIIIGLFVLSGLIVGCRGRDGKDIAGGEMQSFTGVTNVDPFGLQVDNFGTHDEITVYYAAPSANNTFFELKGPDTPTSLAPYYSIGFSGSSILVRLHNVPIGSYYRILVWRPAGII